jgi:ketosteroid isomerase-like protein
MSEQNPEIVRAAIGAYNWGDWDAAFKDAAPGFEWDNPRAIGADNKAGWTLGQALQFFRESRDLWESVWIEIYELIPMGDHVVVPHTAHVRGRDGIEARARTTWLFTIRNSQIERVCLYQEEQKALEAAGLPE